MPFLLLQKKMKMKKLVLSIGILFGITSQIIGQCACCAGAGIGSSNGDYNNGILTLPKKTIIAESYGDYRTIQNGTAVEKDEKLLRSMFIASVGLRYGINDKLTIATLLPYVSLHTNSGNDNGLGDLILMSTYSIYQKNNFNLALQAGVELPTGIRKSSNFDNTTVIVGSGSFDPMLGISFSKRWDKLTLQGSGLYKYTTKGFENNLYGSLSTQNLSFSYRIFGGNNFCAIEKEGKKETSKVGLSLFGGYYGEWLGSIVEDEIVDENSGYYLGFANTGANFSYKTWTIPLTFSLPLVHHLNGNQNKAGYRIRLGLIKAF
jgi:Putative MetA-pathway of phenol degradation